MAAIPYGPPPAVRGPAPRRAPALLPGVLQTAGWAGAAGVLALWWYDTADVTGAAGWLTGAGRITGLLAGYACAVLLLLMARVPALDRGIGTDRLARWHAMGGRYAVCLALAHTLLIVWGYALTTRTGVVDQTTTLVLRYPEMLKGTAGFLLLVATGVLSARVARRRLSYETWHYLHFATYLAVFLVFGHQLANGADFVDHRAARTLWYVLYLGVAAAVLWYRFLLPVRRSLRHRLTVAAVRTEAPGVVSVYVTGRRLDELGARAGQFLRWRFLTPGLWWTASPYSLSAAPRPDALRITVKALGAHSEALARLEPGTRVWIEGPYGGLTADRAAGRRTLLLAGGIGITPLRSLLETLPGVVTLVYWAHRPEDLALREELESLAVRLGHRVVCSVSDPAGHRVPLTAGTLAELAPGLAEHDVYVCGPPGMTRDALRALRVAGVPRGRVHHESFAF
ncbi:ferredoxin reductase family protein [Streptomyces sp. NPDC051940]|uniref:ferredoxin reductase family protein n=1 Tax=Streptomyces sp. NPDC051940 TaxID=3155675 RepID=UPI00342A3916